MPRLARLLVVLPVALSAVPALAGPPGEAAAPGRYTLQPVDGGFIRLDTATGEVAHCKRKADALACDAVRVDGDLQGEVARLAAENKALREEIARLGGDATGDKRADGRPHGSGPKLSLPTEEDVDKALNYVERMIKKFRDKLRDLEGGGAKGTPL